MYAISDLSEYTIFFTLSLVALFPFASVCVPETYSYVAERFPLLSMSVMISEVILPRMSEVFVLEKIPAGLFSFKLLFSLTVTELSEEVIL